MIRPNRPPLSSPLLSAGGVSSCGGVVPPLVSSDGAGWVGVVLPVLGAGAVGLDVDGAGADWFD